MLCVVGAPFLEAGGLQIGLWGPDQNSHSELGVGLGGEETGRVRLGSQDGAECQLEGLHEEFVEGDELDTCLMMETHYVVVAGAGLETDLHLLFQGITNLGSNNSDYKIYWVLTICQALYRVPLYFIFKLIHDVGTIVIYAHFTDEDAKA